LLLQDLLENNLFEKMLQETENENEEEAKEIEIDIKTIHTVYAVKD
jgi:hypothetical protein